MTPRDVDLACRALTARPYDYADGILRTVFEALDRREAGLLIAHLNRWREKGDGLTDAEEREVDGWFPRPADKMGGEVSDGA